MNRSIDDQAADWIARRNGGLTPAEQTELAAWLGRDPRHAATFAALDRTWAQLNEPRQTGRADAIWAGIETLRHHRIRRRRRIAFATAGLTAILALLVGPWFLRRSAPTPVASVATANPTLQILDDGTRVSLRPGAVIEVKFDPTTRGVRLVRGEALFSVKKDPARPFIVWSGEIAVRAVGTEFSVGSDASAVTVLVTEGRVSVANGSTPPSGVVPPAVFATAGHRVVVPRVFSARPPDVSSVDTAEISRALAWHGERLEFSHTPLGEAVRMVNRRAGPQVVLADPALSQRTITGVLWTDDRESFVRLLETGLDLKAERDGSTIRLRAQK